MKYKTEIISCANCGGTGKRGPFNLLNCQACNGYGTRSFNYDETIPADIIARLKSEWPQPRPGIFDGLIPPLFR